MRRSTGTPWSTVGAIALVLVGGSLLPLPFRRRPEFDLFGPDKALHLLGYFGLAAAVADALAADGIEPPRNVVLAVIWSATLGTATGMLQEYVPGRAHERADVAAGVFGAVFGVLYWNRRHRVGTSRSDGEQLPARSARSAERVAYTTGHDGR